MQQIGLSLKPQHYTDVLALTSAECSGLWWEVHPENYFVDGGPRLAALHAVRQNFPLSLHSVSLNLGGQDPLDLAQLKRLRDLADRFEVARVSDHLAWQQHQGRCYPDLLPVLRTRDSLERMISRVAQCQDALGRRLAIENPSHYLALPHEMSEHAFLAELAQRSGCTLLLDINNVAVSAHNMQWDAAQYLNDFPMQHVSELHLAGHRPDENPDSQLLIDTHDAPVGEQVLQLYVQVLHRRPDVPCLIERDGQVPELAELLHERSRVMALA